MKLKLEPITIFFIAWVIMDLFYIYPFVDPVNDIKIQEQMIIKK